jgi:hypothetical protein
LPVSRLQMGLGYVRERDSVTVTIINSMAWREPDWQR